MPITITVREKPKLYSLMMYFICLKQKIMLSQICKHHFKTKVLWWEFSLWVFLRVFWQVITAAVYLDDLLGLELPDWHEILRLHTTIFLNEPMDRGIPCCKGWNVPKLHGSCLVPPEIACTQKNGPIVGPKQPVGWQLYFLTLACKLPGSADRRYGSLDEIPERFLCPKDPSG